MLRVPLELIADVVVAAAVAVVAEPRQVEMVGQLAWLMARTGSVSFERNRGEKMAPRNLNKMSS